MTRQRAGLSGVKIQAGSTDYSLFHNAQTGSGGPPSLLFSGCRGLFIVMRLRLSGAISPLLPVCLSGVGTDNFKVLSALTVH